MNQMQVAAIHIYPVKSCQGISVDSSTVIDTGLEHDRIWQVVNTNGESVTQRANPALATIATAIDGNEVSLFVPQHGSITLSSEGAAPVTVLPLVGKRPVNGVDGGDSAAEWISDFLGDELRFAGITPESKHRPPSSLDAYEQTITFVDLAPVLLTNSASLAWLQAKAKEPFGMDRFRANVVIDAPEPWVEDTWHEMSIGETAVTAEMPWPRCAIPQIDQITGERNREPAVALRAHRWCSEAPTLEGNWKALMEGNGLFGMSCRIGPPGSTIKVGDQVEVRSFQDPIIQPPT